MYACSHAYSFVHLLCCTTIVQTVETMSFHILSANAIYRYVLVVFIQYVLLLTLILTEQQCSQKASPTLELACIQLQYGECYETVHIVG